MMDAISIVEKFKVEHCVMNACERSAPRLADMLEMRGGRGLVLVGGRVHSLVGFTEEETAEIIASPPDRGTAVLPDGSVVRAKII